ncbi:MAG: hypothetical protein SCH66_04740, partial [Methanolobus sp.]|nr:hypothetical protein [Methanolobus sp.]
MFLNESIPIYISEVAGYPLGTFQSNLSAAIAILVASVVVAFVADIVFEKVFLHYASRTKYEGDDLIVSTLKKPIFFTVVLIGFFVAAETVYMGNVAIEFIAAILFTILGVIWILSLLQINKILFEHVFSVLVKKTDTQMDDELLPLFRNIISVLVVFFGFLAILKGI